MNRALAAGLALLAGSAPVPPAHDVALHLVGTYQIGQADGFGGISGIDYDARRDEWLLATDDRGEHGPARYWRARIGYDDVGVTTADIGAATPWRQQGGGAYAARSQPGLVADIEALRIDPLDGTLWYASEGDRAARIPSFIHHASRDGAYLGEAPLPQRLRIQPDCACGGRSNVGPEGLAFTPDGGALWVAMEGPLIEDGPLPDATHGALARLTLMSRAGTVLAQYAYPLDPVPGGAGPADNGISEILALDAQRLLVLERSGRRAGGGFVFDTRLYVVDVAGAQPVPADAPLDPGKARPLGKWPVTGYLVPSGWQDNYEAMAWGPRLADGRRTLVVASDNNFTGAPTRLLMFVLAN
ncbi:hypothetical protein IP92_05489 [Pseudoduganella flava]|uniref:Phytase-like domain-containing protein n=1 Tax=Pseudoduganella flava TaxID=871742 RepID=A0A562PDV2_9BURK|nr:esterase-like activity of phytase family protein [Pseudoduganella flava]TWI42513.1 hypothetical protein IP92_05489 [Pseudoduganella flava]